MMRAVCPSCPKLRLITFVKHSPRSDLSGGQMPENPEEEDASSGALQRICSPKSGRRYWIKGSVLRQQIWSLWGSHGMCFYFVFPCSFNPLSSEKGIFCVWPCLEALVNLLPSLALDSRSCADLPWQGHTHKFSLPGLCTSPGYTSSNMFPSDEKWAVARDGLYDTEGWLIGWLPWMIIWKRSVEEKDNTAVIFKETGPSFSTCQPRFLWGVFPRVL